MNFKFYNAGSKRYYILSTMKLESTFLLTIFTGGMNNQQEIGSTTMLSSDLIFCEKTRINILIRSKRNQYRFRLISEIKLIKLSKIFLLLLLMQSYARWNVRIKDYKGLKQI